MLIAFEGIDGSGKTTLSNRLARELRAQGSPVVHLREGGQIGSRISNAIRELTRDVRHLALSDRAELLLYCAREVQLQDELARPALARGELVLADRSIYSHLALACGGRGLSADEARPVIEFSAGGTWPDLVVLVDVDPALARARKRTRKLTETQPREGSRKGLSGEGLTVRVRELLLALAKREPERWLVVRNEGRPLEEVMAELVLDVTKRIALRRRKPLGAPPPVEIAATGPARPRRARTAAPMNEAELRARFFAALSDLAAREPGAAAVMLTGVSLPEADALRERLVFAVPEIVGPSLAGVETEAAWTLRRSMIRRAPRAVALSLAGLTPEGFARAAPLRDELADAFPRELLQTTKGILSSDAWALRLRFAATHPLAVLESLAGMDDAPAWELREKLGAAKEAAPALLQSLAGLASERAWERRDSLGPELPLPLLSSLRGLTCDRSFDLRERWAERAVRPVVRSLAALDVPRAWALRERLLARVPEVLEGFGGNDSAAAWRLREKGAGAWPSKAVRSLGWLSREPRGAAFLSDIVARRPQELSILRAAVAALLAPRPLPAIEQAEIPGVFPEEPREATS